MSYLSWLLPNGKVSFHHSPKPALLPLKNNSGESKYISLSDFCKSATPPKCQLNPLLFNGHLQTAWTVMKGYDVPIYYKRWTFEADNDNFRGTFDVDFVVKPYEIPLSNGTEKPPLSTAASPTSDLPPRTTFYTEKEFASVPSDDSKPMLIILHGLSGGSYELYLRHVIAPLLEQGWEACVVNFRGCANSVVTGSVLYNARATWDVRQFVKWAKKKFPSRPLFGVGFSLGGNILTNYLGEEGDACLLSAAVVCSNPWNLEIGSVALQSTWLGSEVYSKTMANNMKRLFELHVDKVSKHPRVNVERVRNTTYLHEFDRELQGPVWGYPTENAYYRDASSSDSVFAIKIPFFAINAEDDPISVKGALPYNEMQRTPYGVMCTTSWGGHLSWFEYGGGRWFAKPMTAFLNKMATEVDLKAPLKVEKDDTHVMCDIPEPGSPINKTSGPSPDFQPMRRRWKMPATMD